MGGLTRRRVLLGTLLLLAVSGYLVFSGPSAEVGEEPVKLTIPSGASFQAVVDSLQSRGLITKPRLFRTYARLKGADSEIRAGQYELLPGTPWSELLLYLTEGRVVTEPMTIPEGFTLSEMAPRIAEITGLEPDSVQASLEDDSFGTEWEVPGPGLEGYLFPDTYRFARGAPLRVVVGAMVEQYREFWTPARIELKEVRGMSEKEIVTLASIVQAEARIEEEMPIIASVYHNRLSRGIPLQADPTVLYALGGQRARLLYAAMDSVADHPYNTYTHAGLPPGPIGAPGTAALDATLRPADTEFLYFVARTDGTHVFSRTLAEHNRAVQESRRDWERYRQEQRARESGTESTDPDPAPPPHP